MNLWQIRHIPNSWRKLVSLTLLSAIGLMLTWWSGMGVSSARGQGDTKSSPAKPADPEVSAAATEMVKKVHRAVYEHSSIKADIEQTVNVGNQHFLASGRYVSSGPKLRLEYSINPGQGITGGLLEICDGKDLWSLIDVLDNKRVTHRDVQQIKAAILETRTVAESVLTGELGLGGLPGLIASLERIMVFDAMKEVTSDDGSTITVQGKWRPDYQKAWPRVKDELPPYIPDLVRISIDAKTMFPVKIVYVKRVVEKEKVVLRPLVSLKFSNVEFDQPIGEQEFAFSPPEKIVPEDITRQYLDRIKRSAEAAAATAAGAANPAGPPASK